jgi:probable selenium-dependent hydroxylase accessory protein YqeC
MNVVEALDARSGLTCAVGAGGKKTTLHALATRLDRAVVTATVRIPIFDSQVSSVLMTEDPASALSAVEAWPIGVVPERERDDRYRGYDGATVDAIAESDVAESVLVKADGARMREFKAPDEDEPQIPDGADTVVPIASAHVVGEPLTEEHVHRPERVAAIADIEVGDTIRASDVAAVLSSERGGLKDIPSDATAIPLINKVDDAADERVGRDIADEILARADVPRVVLARMKGVNPLVAVVE